MKQQSAGRSITTKASAALLAGAFALTACGGSDNSGTDDAVPLDAPGGEASVESDQSESDSTDSGEFVESSPFAALSAMANLPHGVGPVGVTGECSATQGSYQFASSGDDRFQLVILDGSPPTVESAMAFLGTKTYAFAEIDTVEAGPDRYFVSGTGSEIGRETEAGPMSFTILCSNEP